MRYAEVTRAILASVPELELAYQDLRGEWDPDEEPGQYIVFEDLFGVYVDLLLIRKDRRAQGKLTEVFRFVETLLCSDDREVRYLAMAGMLEGKGPAWLRRVSPYLGTEARRYLDEHRRGWEVDAAGTADTLKTPIDIHDVARVFDTW